MATVATSKRMRNAAPGRAARRIWWIRAARGQSERGGAFPAFGSTDPRTRQPTNLFSRAKSNICHQNSLAQM
jgi:hypothetical protein